MIVRVIADCHSCRAFLRNKSRILLRSFSYNKERCVNPLLLKDSKDRLRLTRIRPVIKRQPYGTA